MNLELPRAHLLSNPPILELDWNSSIVRSYFQRVTPAAPAINIQPIDYSVRRKLIDSGNHSSSRLTTMEPGKPVGVPGAAFPNWKQENDTLTFNPDSFPMSISLDGNPGSSGPQSNLVTEPIQSDNMQKGRTQVPKVKSFQCLICDRLFGYKHVLTNHIRTHTGERPYKCSICSKQFARDHHLKVHLRLHSGVKPYRCTTCGKTFRQIANLRCHQRVHTNKQKTPTWACVLCGLVFKSLEDRSSHIAKEHLKIPEWTYIPPPSCDEPTSALLTDGIPTAEKTETALASASTGGDEKDAATVTSGLPSRNEEAWTFESQFPNLTAIQIEYSNEHCKDPHQAENY